MTELTLLHHRITDENGQIVESFTYDNHYGAIISHTKTVETNNPYGYTGREIDTLDLYYYRARYFDPTIERFLSEDPIGFASGDFNWYRYVWNSPIIIIDPYGNAGAIAIGAEIGAEAGSIFGPPGAIIGGAIGAGIAWWGGNALWDWWNSPDDNVCYIQGDDDKEHTKGKRPSTKGKHEKGTKRKNQKYNDKKRKHPNWKPRK